jgi:DNA-binding response OmpR family regulator
MNDLLFVEATEGLQPLAEALERANLRVTACPLVEVRERLDGANFAALLVNVTEPAAFSAAQRLWQGDALPSRTATVALVSHEQVQDIDASWPLDEFVVQPASAEELVARVRRAIWRRAGPESAQLLRCGDLVIDQANYKAFIGGAPVDLTYKEYELLRFLALNQDKVCTREMLLNRVWGYDFYGGARTVDVHIRRLRSKIEDRAHTFIETVRNVGYRFHAS